MENNVDIKKLLGKRIKELRQRKNLTQEQLAEMIDVGERNLSKIECVNNWGGFINTNIFIVHYQSDFNVTRNEVR